MAGIVTGGGLAYGIFVDGQPRATTVNGRNETTAINDLGADVTALNTELGVNPSGSYATVADRLNGIAALGGRRLRAGVSWVNGSYATVPPPQPSQVAVVKASAEVQLTHIQNFGVVLGNEGTNEGTAFASYGGLATFDTRIASLAAQQNTDGILGMVLWGAPYFMFTLNRTGNDAASGQRTITGLSVSGSIVTVTLSANHNYNNGYNVMIRPTGAPGMPTVSTIYTIDTTGVGANQYKITQSGVTTTSGLSVDSGRAHDGSSLTQSRIDPALMSYWTGWCAFLANRFPQVTHFAVWNEMKGYYSTPLNRWDYEAYTTMYNAVYAAIKAVRPSARVGGPYMITTPSNISSANADTNTQLIPTLGSAADQLSADNWFVPSVHLNVPLYWKANAVGYDFVCFDMWGERTDGVPLLLDSYYRKIAEWYRRVFPTALLMVTEAYWKGSDGAPGMSRMLSQLEAGGVDYAAIWHDPTVTGISDGLYSLTTPYASTAVGDAMAAFNTRSTDSLGAIREAVGGRPQGTYPSVDERLNAVDDTAVFVNSFGAKGDTRTVTVTTTAGSTTIAVTSGTLPTTCVGKTFWIRDGNTGGKACIGTILTRPTSTSATLSVAPTWSTVNAPMNYGTDDTYAINQAWLAWEATTVSEPGGLNYSTRDFRFKQGHYMVTGPICDSPRTGTARLVRGAVIKGGTARQSVRITAALPEPADPKEPRQGALFTFANRLRSAEVSGLVINGGSPNLTAFYLFCDTGLGSTGTDPEFGAGSQSDIRWTSIGLDGRFKAGWVFDGNAGANLNSEMIYSKCYAPDSCTFRKGIVWCGASSVLPPQVDGTSGTNTLTITGALDGNIKVGMDVSGSSLLPANCTVTAVSLPTVTISGNLSGNLVARTDIGFSFSQQDQFLNYGFYDCNFEYSSGDALLYEKGGAINVWGGSWILSINPRMTASGTSGTNTLTIQSLSAGSFLNKDGSPPIGMAISGTGIPAATTITAVVGRTVTLSANLTANVTTGTALTLVPVIVDCFVRHTNFPHFNTVKRMQMQGVRFENRATDSKLIDTWWGGNASQIRFQNITTDTSVITSQGGNAAEYEWATFRMNSSNSPTQGHVTFDGCDMAGYVRVKLSGQGTPAYQGRIKMRACQFLQWNSQSAVTSTTSGTAAAAATTFTVGTGLSIVAGMTPTINSGFLSGILDLDTMVTAYNSGTGVVTISKPLLASLGSGVTVWFSNPAFALTGAPLRYDSGLAPRYALEACSGHADQRN